MMKAQLLGSTGLVQLAPVASWQIRRLAPRLRHVLAVCFLGWPLGAFDYFIPVFRICASTKTSTLRSLRNSLFRLGLLMDVHRVQHPDA